MWFFLWLVMSLTVLNSCLLLKRSTLSKSLKTRFGETHTKSPRKSQKIWRNPGRLFSNRSQPKPTELVDRNVSEVQLWWPGDVAVGELGLPWCRGTDGYLQKSDEGRPVWPASWSSNVTRCVKRDVLCVCVFFCLVCVFLFGVFFLFGGCNNPWWLLIYTLEMDGFWLISMDFDGMWSV